MGVADCEFEGLAAHRRAVADALDLEALLEALRDALDHVRDQRAGEPVERPVLPALGRARDDDLAVPLFQVHARGNCLDELAQWPVHLHAAGRQRDADAVRDRNGLSADPAHYQTKAITSPPTPRSAAVRLVTSPDEVDRMAVPRPPRTRGRRSFLA